MNKGGIIGIAVIVIIAVIAGASYFSSESNDELLPIENSGLEEIESLEEITPEEPETAGKEFSVEFSEKIGLKSP